MIDWQRHEDELTTARLADDALRAARRARLVRALLVAMTGAGCLAVLGRRR